MTNLGVNIFDLFVCTIEVFLFTLFLNKMVCKKVEYHLLYPIYCLFLTGVAWGLTFLGINIGLKTCLTLVLQLILVFLFFEGSALRKIFLVTVYKFMLIIADFLSLAIILAMWEIPLAKLAGNIEFVLLGSIVSKLVLFILVLLVVFFQNNKEDHVPAQFWLLFLVFPIMSLLVILLLFRNQVLAEQVFGIQYLIIAVCGIIFMNMVFLFLLDKLSHNLSMNFQLALEKERLMAENQFVDLLLDKQKAISQIWHDLKHHLLIINSYAEKAGDQQVVAYLKNLTEDIREVDHIFRTGNFIIDSVINQKYIQANKWGVEFQLKSNIGQVLGINDNDLCLLVANALDNAIEGIRDTTESLKTVFILTETKDDFFIMTIKNQCEKLNFDKNGRLQTKKHNKDLHGFGLKSIERIVEKYHGQMNIDFLNDEFVLDIILRNTL